MRFLQTNTIQYTKSKQTNKFSIYSFWLLMNTVVFLCLYPLLNFLADRQNPYTLYLSSELQIPFYPYAIIPYLSLPLLILVNYLTIPLNKIKSLALQFIWMTVIAGIFFYFFPAKLGFTRIIPNGIWQTPYQLLFWLDLPHNLFPSLHAGYTTLLAIATRPSIQLLLLRIGYDIWVMSILLSLLFTHQHHVLDILSGVGLAAIICMIGKVQWLKLRLAHIWVNFPNR